MVTRAEHLFADNSPVVQFCVSSQVSNKGLHFYTTSMTQFKGRVSTVSESGRFPAPVASLGLIGSGRLILQCRALLGVGSECQVC